MGRQQIPFLAMALGLESKHEGFLNHLSWKDNKNVLGYQLGGLHRDGPR